MRYVSLLCVLLLGISCSETVARRPVSQSSGTYINNETIARNKERIAQEEAFIKKYIDSDTLNQYTSSNNGFWYTYIDRDTLGLQTPQIGDLVLFKYNLARINGDVLVNTESLGNTVTQIDQSNQELISGIREGLKLMKEGETISFLFPSHKAFGYYGYEDVIPTNTPIRSTITLLEIKNQPKE